MRFRLIRAMPRVRLIPSQAALLPAVAQKVQKRPRRSWGSPWPLLLLLLIPAIFIGALIFRYYTRGPREAGTASTSAPGGKKLTTRTSVLTATFLQSQPTTRREYTTHAAPTTTESAIEKSSNLQLQDTTVAGEQPQGTATYGNYQLPSEPVPAKYTIIMTLTGSELGQVNVTSAVNISFTPRKGLRRIVLKTIPGALPHLKMALLERPYTDGQKAVEVASVTGIRTGEFIEAVEVTLRKALTQGVEHVLFLEHKYAAPSAVAAAPITRRSGLARMELDPGNTHWVFPHIGTEDRKTPVTLTVRTPSNLTVVSNTPLSGGKPDKNSTVWEHRFLETLPMPLQKVAWVAFPTSALRRLPVSDDKATIYAKGEPDANLTRTLQDSFNGLQKFMEPATPTLIKKLDFIMTQGEHQDSLGFILLEQPAEVTPTQICKVVAGQWFKHLLSPPGSSPAETWFSEAGVQYMCLLATTSHDDKLFRALKADLEECINTTAAPSADTSAFLAFRMAHLILGDQKMKSALQRFVAANTFTETTTEDQLAVFAPDLQKENLQPWLTIQQVTTVTVTVGDATLNVFWDTSDPATPERAPFVTNTDVWGVNVRVPEEMEVAWLTYESTHEITGMPTEALLVNPGMAACYNVELTPEMWELIGQRMANGTPALDLVSTWYLVKQAAAKYTKGGFDSSAMVSFMWTWLGLKENATALVWDDVIDNVEAAVNDTYSALQDLGDEQKFKEKLGTLLETRLGMIKPEDLMADNVRTDAANIKLANLACSTMQKQCQEFVPDGVFAKAKIDDTFHSFVKSKTQLDPKAVACRLGALVETSTDFESRVDPSKDDPEAIIYQLAFACCVPDGKATENMMTFAKRVLLMNPAIKPELAGMVSQSFRLAALDGLVRDRMLPTDFVTSLAALLNLQLVRKSEEKQRLQHVAMSYQDVGAMVDDIFAKMTPHYLSGELTKWIQA